MNLSEFPKIVVNTNNDEIVENPFLEKILKEFIARHNDEIAHLEVSCEKIKKTKEDLQTSKDQKLHEILMFSHARGPNSSPPHQLSQIMQTELNMVCMGDQESDEVFNSFHKDQMDWFSKLEEQMQNTLAGDELLELFKVEIDHKIETWRKEAENAKIELTTFEEVAKEKNSLFEDGIQALQTEVNMLESLKSEMRVDHQRSIDDLEEKKLKSQEEENLLREEIAKLKKILELYE